MPVNRDKVDKWKADTLRSVDHYNAWFMRFAPKAYRTQRVQATEQVESALRRTESLTDIATSVLKEDPAVLATLRMATAPPLARDRLTGLAGVSKGLVKTMEEGRLPTRSPRGAELDEALEKIGGIVEKLVDEGIFPWVSDSRRPSEEESYRASTIVADRLCGSQADPIIRNAQEERQLAAIGGWLEARGYTRSQPGVKFNQMEPGTFSFRMNVPVESEDGSAINLPVDVVVMPIEAIEGEMPLLIEAKSAGDYANTNKRRKEEATKFAQLKRKYGEQTQYALFLCGYFDGSYLGYEAAEGIDWVWEHRIDDLAEFGL